MQEFITRFDKYISEWGKMKNSEMCRPENINLTCPAIHNSEEVKNLRICTSQKEDAHINQAVDSIRKSITKLPCTKVTYQWAGTTGPFALKDRNTIKFQFTMQSPYEIEVNEEYLILDLIGVVGSIGGTLGLCIGFSFKDLFRDVGSSVVQAVSRIIRHKKERENQMTSKRLQETGHLQLETYNPEKIATQGDLAAQIIAKLTQLETKLEKRLSDHDSRLLEMEKKLVGQSF